MARLATRAQRLIESYESSRSRVTRLAPTEQIMPPRKPNNWQSVFGGGAWSRVDDGQWYLHLFDPSQPDFDWTNPEVGDFFESVLRFWLDRGADGFRIDVAHGLVKAPGLPDISPDHDRELSPTHEAPMWDQDGVHEIYRRWRRIADEYDDRVLCGEAWVTPSDRLARYVAPDELHQAFNFDFLDATWNARELRATINACLAAADLVGAPTTWVLSNHDKQRHVTRLGSLARARAAALLMLALPGSAYLYQGEELGLAEVLDLPAQARQDPVWFRSGGTDPGRDGCRVPLPWSADAPAYGFSTSGASWLPQPEWGALAVDTQSADPGSTLALYRAALRLRRHAGGGLTWRDSDEGVLDFERDGLRCIVNVSGTPVPLPDGEPALVSGTIEAGWLPRDTAAWYLTA